MCPCCELQWGGVLLRCPLEACRVCCLHREHMQSSDRVTLQDVSGVPHFDKDRRCFIIQWCHFLPPQLPLPEEIHWTPGDSKLHDMSAEEVANQLVVFDWELFSCVHEVSENGFYRRLSESGFLARVTLEFIQEF